MIKNRNKKQRTQASDKKLRKVETVTYSSRNRSPKTRATARRNRSKPKHDSSKTEVTLDTVMLEVEGKQGKPGAKNKAETPQAKLFPLTSATLPK